MGWDGIMCQTVINPFSGFWGLLARKKQRKHSNFLTSNLFVQMDDVGKRTRKNTPSRL